MAERLDRKMADRGALLLVRQRCPRVGEQAAAEAARQAVRSALDHEPEFVAHFGQRPWSQHRLVLPPTVRPQVALLTGKERVDHSTSVTSCPLAMSRSGQFRSHHSPDRPADDRDARMAGGQFDRTGQERVDDAIDRRDDGPSGLFDVGERDGADRVGQGSSEVLVPEDVIPRRRHQHERATGRSGWNVTTGNSSVATAAVEADRGPIHERRPSRRGFDRSTTWRSGSSGRATSPTATTIETADSESPPMAKKSVSAPTSSRREHVAPYGLDDRLDESGPTPAIEGRPGAVTGSDRPQPPIDLAVGVAGQAIVERRTDAGSTGRQPSARGASRRCLVDPVGLEVRDEHYRIAGGHDDSITDSVDSTELGLRPRPAPAECRRR